MNKTLLNTAKIILFAGLGFLLVWLVLRNLSPEDEQEIVDAFVRADYFWIFLAFVVGILSHVFRALRWQLLLEPLNHRPKTITTFFAVMVGYLANTAVPRMGEVSRCTVLTRYENVPFEESFGTVIAERLIDTATLFLLFGITVLWQFERIYDYAGEKVFRPLLGKMGFFMTPGGVLVLGLFSIAFIVGIWWWRKKMRGKKGKIASLVEGFSQGLTTVRKVKRPGVFWFYSVAIWFCYYIILPISFMAFAETRELPLSAGLAALVFGTFGFIAVQGGIGAYPMILMEVLSLFGVASAVGYAFGWVVWCASTLVILLVGFLSLFLLPLMGKARS